MLIHEIVAGDVLVISGTKSFSATVYTFPIQCHFQ